MDALLGDFAAELGRGDAERRRSLSRVFVTVGPASVPVVERVARSGDPLARSHAAVTLRMIDRTDETFDEAVAAVEARGSVA